MELWTSAKGKDAATAYYTAAIGYQVSEFDMGKKGKYNMLTMDNNAYAGIDKTPQPKLAGNWVPYVPVEDVDATAKKVKKLKGKQLGKTTDVPGIGRIAYLQDPAGAVIGIIKPAMEEKAPEAAPAEETKK